ncbi:MAG: hypothetical protein WC295_02765 [Methanoregula sp.]|jgi:hypothetical protein
MKQTFLDWVRESLTAAITNIDYEDVTIRCLTTVPKKNKTQKTNVTFDNRIMNIIIVETKGVHS